jgi:hypothetical protein
MSIDTFNRCISDGTIYLPTVKEYAKMDDPNEGKFNLQIIKALLHLYKYLDHPNPTKAAFEKLAHFADARNNTFVSCWTERFSEDHAMWKYFGENHTGIAIRSDVSLVSEQFFEYQEDNSEFEFCMGPIRYDRENMHKYVNLDIVEWTCFSHFFLSGGSDNFIHEREIRYALTKGYDSRAIKLNNYFDMAKEILKILNTFIRPKRMHLSKNLRGSGLTIPFDFSRVIKDFKFGKNTSQEDKDKIKRTIEDLINY